MKTAYPNRMMNSAHIREIGPHSHQPWKTVGIDTNGDHYQECEACGTRRVLQAATGREPLRSDWLQGAAWEQVENKEQESRKRRRR